MAKQLTTAQFEGLQLSIIDHDGHKWLTADQIGLALGYAADKARQGINNLYKRHQDEFTSDDTCVINLMTQVQQREIRIFSATGCHLLSFFSNTQKAKNFRAWAKQVLSGSVQEELTTNERLEMLEIATLDMASQMRQLVMVSHQQAQKLEVTSRYIGLLEINQKGKLKVTRHVEAKALALRAQGMSMHDIGQVLRISTGAVSQLINGKYPFAAVEAAAPNQTATVQEVLDDMVETERRRLLKSLGGMHHE